MLESRTNLFWNSPITGIKTGLHIEKLKLKPYPIYFLKKKNLLKIKIIYINFIGIEIKGSF